MNMKDPIQKFITSLSFIGSSAYHTASSSTALFHLIKETSVKIAKERSRLKELTKDLELMVALIRAYIRGEYQDIPYKSLVSIAGACLYFLNPIDFIPDFFLLGLVDDVQVLIFVLEMVKNDLIKFQNFRKRTTTTIEDNLKEP